MIIFNRKLRVKLLLLYIINSVLLLSCSKDNESSDLKIKPLEKEINISFIKTDKGLYHPQEKIELAPFSIKNTSNTKVSITTVAIKIRENNDPSKIVKEIIIAENLDIDIGKEIRIGEKVLLENAFSLGKEVFGVYLAVTFSDGNAKETYKTFFRNFDADKPVTYDIVKHDFNGLPVFTLKNGLSAEYAVQKSAANFVSGISHSWETPLQPIASTPYFLERSLDKTISFYDGAIGATTPVETVIISTGIPAIPYVARAMKALVLPLHFLVGCNTIKEASSILEHANEGGYSAYGTLGYDYSISTDTGVVWIKLLDLPPQYKKFIEDHNVKNVLLYGHLGVNDGETIARKIKDDRDKYEKGALYLMHFSGNDSEGYLRQVISDFNANNLEPEVKIADWEAGIVAEQIEQLSSSLKGIPSVNNIASVTAEEGISLWNMGTFSTLALLKKNETIFSDGGSAVRGVSLNPYLIAHPSYESYIRYVPFLYWQGFSAEFQYNNWLDTKIKLAIKSYFPSTVFEDLEFWVNSTNNFGGIDQGNSMRSFLIDKGLTVKSGNFGHNEEWNLGDGINSPSEIRADQLLNNISVSDFKSWNESLQYLNTDDLVEISNRFPEIKVTIK